MTVVKERLRLRRVPFSGDAGWRQMMPPKPDDLLPQDPDWLFLAELAQVSEEQLHEPIKKVLYRVGGPVRDTQDIQLNQYTFLRPKQTQFVLVELQDRQRFFVRYNTTTHGAWEDIQDSGFTPREFIEDIFVHGEEFPAIIQQFLNERKKSGGASKTHWHPDHHPAPRKVDKSM